MAAEEFCCRVCAGQAVFALHVRERMIGLDETFDYMECRECGCLQIRSLPESMTPYYSDAYYTSSQKLHFGPSGGYFGLRRNWTRIRLAWPRLPRVLLGRRFARFDWFRVTATRIQDRILDVGCGSGRLLYRLQSEGFENLTGIDLHYEAGAQGLRERSPVFERTSVEGHFGQYDLVMAHHSFEHFPDPVKAFDAFSRLVRPGGHLLLRIPIADCWARRHYAQDWVQLDAPRHLHLHTRRSIAWLADHSGFRVIREDDDSGPFQVWGSELYRQGDSVSKDARRGLGLRRRAAARWRARRLSKEKLGDQACFYLQRMERAPYEPH